MKILCIATQKQSRFVSLLVLFAFSIGETMNPNYPNPQGIALQARLVQSLRKGLITWPPDGGGGATEPFVMELNLGNLFRL
jgi:hypothetical protein